MLRSEQVMEPRVEGMETSSARIVRIDRVEVVQVAGQGTEGHAEHWPAGTEGSVFLTRIHASHADQRIVETCEWVAKSGWAALTRAAAALTGKQIMMGEEHPSPLLQEIFPALLEEGLPTHRAHSILASLERILELAVEGHSGNGNDAAFLAGLLPGVVRYRSFPESAPSPPAFSAEEARIEKVQAIHYRIRAKRRDPDSASRSQSVFVLLLHVRLPDGEPLEVPLQWHAPSGWTRTEQSIKELVGLVIPVDHEHAHKTISACMERMDEAGFPASGLPALGYGLGEMLVAAHDPGKRAPRPLDYPAIMPGVTRYACFPEPPMPTWNGMPMNIYDGVTYLHPLGGNGAKGHLLERQALAYGLSTLRYNKGTFLASDGEHEPLNFKWSRSPISSGVSLSLCTHKEATRARLSRAGVPVPRGRMFVNGDFESAYLYADRIGYPVVCKPVAGVRGIGVVANIQNEDELREALRQMSASKLGGDDFIIEKHVHGRDYRIIVLGDKVIAAILREPASVIGDGKRNVAELVMHKNSIRRLNPHLWARPAKYDEAMRYQLKRAGLSLYSVPEAGRTVILSNTCSLSQGGDSIDVLDELHPSIRDASIAAVKAIPGLNYCGVDFLIEDHTKPVDGQSAGICELNAHAAIGNCEYPLFGNPRQVAREFLHLCATTHGLNINEEPAEKLAIRILIRGRVTRVGYRRWLKAQADRFGVKGWVQNVDRRCVEAVLVGETAPVTAMASGAVLGPAKAFPTSVQTEHVPWDDLEGFEIKSGYAGRNGNGD